MLGQSFYTVQISDQGDFPSPPRLGLELFGGKIFGIGQLGIKLNHSIFFYFLIQEGMNKCQTNLEFIHLI